MKKNNRYADLKLIFELSACLLTQHKIKLLDKFLPTQEKEKLIKEKIKLETALKDIIFRELAEN